MVSTVASYDLPCEFATKRGAYTCTLTNLNLVDATEEMNIISTETEGPIVLVVSFVKSKVTYISPKIFEKFNKVEYLWMQEVQVESINEGSFKYAGKLKEIKLANNLIKNVPARTFTGCTALMRLYLQANQIIEVAVDAFEGLKMLKFILLNNNGIKELNSATFATNENLERIDLNHNELKAIPGDLFKGNLNLKTIYLNNNQIDML